MGAAGDLAYCLDPVAWALALDFEPDPWQADVLRSSKPRLLLNCCRQSGKSTTTALLALHTALYRPGALVLLLSPSLRQSSELFRRVAGFYHVLADPIPSEAESVLRVELTNGSRVVSLPGKEQTVRGFSGVDLLVVDEASRVTDDLYFAVRPMLAVSGGRLIALSTPFGKRGWWFESWEEEGDTWERTLLTAYDCPRIGDEFLEQERRAMPEAWFRQEYLCQFAETTDQVFSYEEVMAAISADIKPLFEIV